MLRNWSNSLKGNTNKTKQKGHVVKPTQLWESKRHKNLSLVECFFHFRVGTPSSGKEKKLRLCFDKTQAKFWFPYHEKERENLNDKTIARRGETFCRFDLISSVLLCVPCWARALFHDKKKRIFHVLSGKKAWVKFWKDDHDDDTWFLWW